MDSSKVRDDRHDADFSFDIDVQETVDFQIDTSDDDYIRSRYRGPEGFSYWKFFLGLFLVSLAVFAIIKMYNYYERKKEVEAAIIALEELNQELERDFQRTMDRFSAPTRPTPQYEYIDEMYRASDGTWKNRKRKVEVKK